MCQALVQPALAAAFVATLRLSGQGIPEYELPPISYSTTQPTNPVEALQEQLRRGEPAWSRESDKETLRQCLTALNVSADTQVLVFSKTSLQRNRIHPEHPRAIFFSDDCYVGWVPGGLFEVSVTDPSLGLVFYRFDPHPGSGPLRFERDEECLSCHAGPLTRQWPALIVRSVFPDANGEPITRAGSFLTDHQSPLSERWGGWYVTGQHGADRHMGNATATMDDQARDVTLDREPGANLDRLDRFFPTDQYLRPDSDVVALMLLEHQVTLHNRLAEGALRVRRWMHYQQALQRELGEPLAEEPTGTALRVVESETRRILEALLFVGEAALPAGGIHGHADFQKAFHHNRRPDGRNRSLKDLNLHTRLLEYRCSYLIHSSAFYHLPAALKAHVYRKLREVLDTREAPPPFDHLGRDERLAIAEILDTTQPEWRNP